MTRVQVAPDTALQVSMFDELVVSVRAGQSAEDAAELLLGEMSADEQLSILHGDVEFWPGRGRIMEHGYSYVPFVMGSLPRLGIPGISFIDGPRGVVVGNATAFPVAMARGASWDRDLEEQIGAAIGREVRASGGNLFGGVCINLPRHPAWGRAQETYSDQPLILGELGAALVRGVRPNAMACVKHFALNSMENARFDVDVTCSDEAMHEDFLPHFERAISEGAESVMCAYNSVNGSWASESRQLLDEVLRQTWGFDGFVLSDFIWAIRDASASLEAGLDLEAPFAQLRAERLPAEIAAGRVSWERVHASAARILCAQLRHYAFRDQAEPTSDLIAGTEHRNLARRAAQRSMVLLKNDGPDGPILPIADAESRTIAVIGQLANAVNLGDKGSSNVTPPETVTALAGIRAGFHRTTVVHHDGADLEEAAKVAAAADVVIVVVGYTAQEEGEWVNGRVYARDDLMALYPQPRSDEDHTVVESMFARLEAAKGKPEAGGDRTDLRLLPHDEALIHALTAVNARTVVVLQSAGAVLTRPWDDGPAGIVLMWYAGMEGGHALADLLKGDVDFSGRLPFAMVADPDDLPDFRVDATSIEYDRWYGQRLIAARGSEAAYPLGFGLSYARHGITGPRQVTLDGTDGTVTVDLVNEGRMDSRVVAQVYATRLDGDRAGERELVGFTVVPVVAGGQVRATIPISLRPLARWSQTERAFVLPSGDVRIEVSRHWGDPQSVSTTITL
ncbi:beta-glucosidase family protein [Tessaracoccus palaemonis]|uniref:Glycoside hydrolase family 3 C-terminal domain-containing protein n=1 Tax=Tessaracoccus palaemonis TaxID=2829499 RepID=A0ABX8SLL3_9ACTN|nr:glycoside hydrolase family 3 C-terminal domain-containing protein [Tessaracoccus palaemonis]QXT62908.1 glycoside hydrolase family 3 C-terminal domain-containing protein [Tessaracoccus palaemonis]